jgi:cytochrome c biogenesis DsbD-like protein
MRRLPVALLLLGAALGWTQEAQMSTLPKPEQKQIVNFEPPEAPVTVAAGKPGTITLRFVIAPGMHINSNQPKSQFLIPTALHLDTPTDIGATVHYPEAQEMSFAFDPNEKLGVYSGTIALKATLSAARTASPGRYNVHGFLDYQGCNDRQCLPPQKLAIVFPITVGKSRIARERKRLHGNAQSPHIH